MNTGEPAFLTLLSLPDGADADDVARDIARITSMDLFQVRQRINAGLPGVLKQAARDDGARIARELIRAGVRAFAPASSQLRSVATRVSAKRLAPAHGAPTPMFLCEPWRGESFGFPGDAVACIVRARLMRSASKSTIEEVAAIPNPLTGTSIPIYDSVRTSSSSIHDVMDIYLTDRRCVRCSGDKFNFEGLGGERGYSDNENMDKLAFVLGQAAPRAIIDLNFAKFSCPPLLLRAYTTSREGEQRRDDHPAFDFYSPWTVLVHAALARREK